MAKLIYSAISSADGYVEDPNGSLDWGIPDEELLSFINELERPARTYLYGRRMYETMAYWETAPAFAGQPRHIQDFAALWRAGFANQPSSQSRDDGLRLCDTWITAAVRCAPPANRPTPAERDTCLPWSVRELRLLENVRVVLCLGAFAWDAALRLTTAFAGPGASLPKPRPRFGHGAELGGEPYSLIGCYHPSQQNTFTGKLTEPMIDAVLERARELAEGQD